MEHCIGKCCTSCECECPVFDDESCNETCHKLSHGQLPLKGVEVENVFGCKECRCILAANSCPEEQNTLSECTNKCSIEDKIMVKEHCSNSCCIKCQCRCPAFDVDACNELCKSSGVTSGRGNNELGCTVCRCVPFEGNPGDELSLSACPDQYISLATCANHCFLEDKIVNTDYCTNRCCSQCECGCRHFDSIACNKQCQQLGVIKGEATLNTFGCDVCKCLSFSENSRHVDRNIQKEQHFSSGLLGFYSNFI